MPELGWIGNPDLRGKCARTWVEAAVLGNWDEASLAGLPFVIKELENCPVTLIQHVRNVTGLAAEIQSRVSGSYGEYLAADRDVVIAGALLHDVGKLLEYTFRDGRYVPSEEGVLIRHPLAGAMVAERCGVPPEVVHIVATHSFEGEKSYKSPEAFIVRSADWINFDFLAYRFPNRLAK